MNKKGFTIVELLAVIIILAVIALIASSVVTSIIENSKKGAAERGTEIYLDAVETAVGTERIDGKLLEGTYLVNANGDICPEAEGVNCSEDKQIKIEMIGDKPSRGTLKVVNGKVVPENVSLIIKDYEVTYDEKEEKYVAKLIEEEPEPSTICRAVEGATKEEGKISIGDKYKCHVDPNKDPEKEPYYFYVLSENKNSNNEVVSYNLIMDQNINSDGTPAGLTMVTKSGTNVYNVTAWCGDLSKCSTATYGYCSNNNGPVTAIEFLDEATKNWNDKLILNEDYTDETGIYGKITFTGKARLIYKKEVAKKDEKPFLYDNLEQDKAYGYWTAYATSGTTNYSYHIYYGGNRNTGADYFVNYSKTVGIRPVIKVAKSELG